MSISATTLVDPNRAGTWSESSLRLAKRLCDVSHFLRDLRVHLRFGELTRAPLRMLRFQVSEDVAECDWMARAPDPWDADLPAGIGQRHASLQAIKDAIDLRNLLFLALPEVDKARLRVYRASARSDGDLIIVGNSERGDNPARRIHSLAMRAQLLGFRFSLENGILHRL